MSALRERSHVSLNAPRLLGRGGGRQLNHVSCEINSSPEQTMVVFLDSLKSTGTDESAQSDTVLSSAPGKRFPRDMDKRPLSQSLELLFKLNANWYLKF